MREQLLQFLKFQIKMHAEQVQSRLINSLHLHEQLPRLDIYQNTFNLPFKTFEHFIHASKYSFLSFTVNDNDSPDVPCINTPTFPINIY